MELSQLDRYPVSAPFVLDNGESLDVTFNANYFSRTNVTAFDKRLSEALEAVRSPLTTRFAELQSELEAISKIKDKKKLAESHQRADEISMEISQIAEEHSAVVEDTTKAEYAAELAGSVLLGWGMTSGGQPVQISTEILKAQPLLFLRDLYEHCRDACIPKSQRLAKTRASLTTTSQTTSDTY